MYIQECLILNTDGSDPILPAQICMMMHWYKISKGQGFLSPIRGGPNFFHNHSGGQPPLKIHAPPTGRKFYHFPYTNKFLLGAYFKSGIDYLINLPRKV